MRSFLILLLPYLLMAESIELLFEKVVQSDSYKSRLETLNANFQATKADMSTAGLSLGTGASYADFKDNTNSGLEYELGVAKEFNINPFQIDNFLQKSERYRDLQAKSILNRYKVKVWQLYGNYCITMAALQAKAELSSVYEAMRTHIEKGVEYGEFESSKLTISNLALESLNLQLSKLENLVQTYESQIKVLVEFDGEFECRRMGVDLNKLFDPEKSALWPLLESGVDTANAELAVAQQNFNKINVEAKYMDELDTRRGTLNLVVPLYVGEKNEAKRLSALSKMGAANYELASFKNRYRHESSALQSRLDIYKKYLLASEKKIIKDANSLIEQSNMRFLAGEESFLSMIKATETKLNMIETILELKLQRHDAVAEYMYAYSIDPQGVKKW